MGFEHNKEGEGWSYHLRDADPLTYKDTVTSESH